MKSMEQPKVSGQVCGLIPGLMPLVQDPIGVRLKTHQLMSKRCMVLSMELLVATVANGPLDVGMQSSLTPVYTRLINLALGSQTPLTSTR
eukprot:5767206-Amphidinium_carterae.1